VSPGDFVALFNGTLGAFGVLVIVFALILSGHLVTKREMDRVTQDRDEWKRAAEISDARADAIIDVSKITNDVMGSLHRELRKTAQEGPGPP
jgi:hypothetical protein